MIRTASTPFVCDRCGWGEYVDVPIHGGASVRRDCARCGRTADFPEWYGVKRVLDTRLAAAIAIEPHRHNMVRQVLEFIRQRGEHGATDEEICLALRMRGSSERPRRIELVEHGLIDDSTRRRQSRAGRPCIVWIATGERI